MKLIVAVDDNWGIGNDGKLLYRIPEDMKFFRNETKNNIIIVGRKTLDSFPNGEPLPNRENIVLTRNQEVQSNNGLTRVHSMEELGEYIKDKDTNRIYWCGGESIYYISIDYCDTALVTKIHVISNADKHCPNIDKMSNWHLVKTSGMHEYNGIPYEFITYKNDKPKSLSKLL